MQILNFRKKIEICSPDNAFPCCEKADSEMEWVKTMRSLNKKHCSHNRRLSIDNESLIKPCFNYLNETDNKLDVRATTNDQRQCCKRLFSSSRWYRDDEMQLPSQINFGSNFKEDFGLIKRESLNDGFQQNPKHQKQPIIADDIVSECDKKRSHTETKPFSSVYNYSSDNSSVESDNSDSSTLKVGNNKFFFENVDCGNFHRYQNLHSLHKLLKKHFKCQELTKKDVQLFPHELLILRSIITRKYKNKINFNIENLFIKDKLNQITQLHSNKRPEENYKFIFKRCLKYIKDDFKAMMRQKHKKEDMDRAFYSFYFKEIAESEHVGLENFYHPRNSRSKCKNLPKTINSDYIENICKSRAFITKFLDYAYNHLQKEYEEVIDTKIESLIKKWDELFNTNRPKDEIINEITAYIEKNKKCKLPWNFAEINEAIGSIRRLFKDYIVPC